MCRRTAEGMVFENIKQPFAKLEFEFPTLKSGELLVKINYTTICTSDLHTFYGRRKSPINSILGHEITGRIADLPDEGVMDFFGNQLKIGDRITWSVYAHKSDDNLALKGMPQKSKSLFKYGHEAITPEYQLSGGFATHCHLKKGSTVFKIDEQMSEKEAAPLNCTHATISGAFRLAGNVKNKNVLVSGVGMLGLSACAMAKESGARHVFSSDIDEGRLLKSKDFGAEIILNAALPIEQNEEQVKDYGGIDVIIETSGMPIAIEKSIGFLNIGGVCVLIGSVFPQRDVSINAEQIVRKLLTIKGLHNYIHEDLASAINFISKNREKYPFDSLVSRAFALDQLDEAFEFANTNSCYRVGIYTNDNK